MMADIFIILMIMETWNWEELIVRWLEILKVGLSTPSVSWGDASILENRGNIDDDDDDDGILVNDDEKDDDGDYDEKQLRELGAGRPAPCLAGNQLISHHRSNQDNEDDGEEDNGDDDEGDVDNGKYDIRDGLFIRHHSHRWKRDVADRADHEKKVILFVLHHSRGATKV